MREERIVSTLRKALGLAMIVAGIGTAAAQLAKGNTSAKREGVRLSVLVVDMVQPLVDRVASLPLPLPTRIVPLKIQGNKPERASLSALRNDPRNDLA